MLCSAFASWLFANICLSQNGILFLLGDEQNELRNALEPATDLNNEQGLEMFYLYAVMSWFHISGDIQYIDPASGSYNNSLAVGLRTNI